jgi:hypothetical protein
LPPLENKGFLTPNFETLSRQGLGGETLGTALVAYEDQSAWEAAHDLQHEKAQKRQVAFPQLLKINGVYFAGLLLFAVVNSNIDSNASVGVQLIIIVLNVLILLIFVTASIIIAPKFINLFQSDIRNLPLDCPTCYETINMRAKWACGHCRERHEKLNDNTPFLGCKNPKCNATKGIPKHRAQAALQCPHCKDHIVLNPLMYKDIGSHKDTLKYPGVARFLTDKSPPTLGGLPPEELPDVGDLGSVFRAAMDKSI